MPRTGLSPEQIRTASLALAVDLIRRLGFDKLRLTDVARGLGVSHAALYAHFASREALLDAVTGSWLAETETALQSVAALDLEPPAKVRHWMLTLCRMRREHALHEPDLFRGLEIAATQDGPVVIAHTTALRRQLAALLTEARLDGGGGERRAGVLMAATTAFHHPSLVARHAGEDREPLLAAVLDMMLAGMAR